MGPWAVVVAEDLEIFWAFRKGEGCLGGTRPDTAAIRCGYEGREPKSMEGKVGGRCSLVKKSAKNQAMRRKAKDELGLLALRREG